MSTKSELDDLTTQLPQIPDDIIRTNIICRLPGESQMKFRCVSKSWNSWISENFALQSTKAVFMSFEKSDGPSDHVWWPSIGVPRFYFVDSESSIQKSSWKTPLALKSHHQICFAGSCDGLLLIVVGTSFYLWNPVTGYCSHVLELDILEFDLNIRDHYYVITHSGICYDSCTDDYKVVIGLTNVNTYTPYEKHDFVLVSGLRNKGWKKINRCAYQCHPTTSGVLFNGFLHWGAFKNHDFHVNLPPNRIIAFDASTDEVSELPLPQYCKSMEERIGIVGLGVLEDRLCMAFRKHKEVTKVKLLLMKEYGVKESWTPLFAISNPAFDEYPFSIVSVVPLMLMQNDNVLMATSSRKKNMSMFCYNLETMECNVDDNCPKDWGEIFSYGYPHLLKESLNSPTGLEWDEKQHHGVLLPAYRKERRHDFERNFEDQNYSSPCCQVKHFMDDS